MSDPTTERPDDDDIDPRLFWRWVGKATRPVVGWVLVAAGALFVLVGWFGVSREAIVAKQIPYVVSGGIAGVLLAVVGAYFLGTEELRKDSGRLDRLERMVLDLHRALVAEEPAAEEAVQPSQPEPDEEPEAEPERHGSNGKVSLVTLSGSHIYHRAGCAMVEGKRAAALVPATVRKRNLQPCPLCEPG